MPVRSESLDLAPLNRSQKEYGDATFPDPIIRDPSASYWT
jgi:hypothetical protein